MCVSGLRYGFTLGLVVADGQGSSEDHGVRVCDVGKPPRRLDRMLQTTAHVYKAAVTMGADLYHLHDPELMPVGLKLKRLGKRVIFDAHEDLPKQILGKAYLSRPARLILPTLVARYESYACSRFDGVIAATPFIKEKFLSINPNTVDICNFPIVTELSNELAWPDKRREVCYVGGLCCQRGVTELVSALSMCRQSVRLNLCGFFELASYDKEVRQLSGWGSVNALGHLGRDRVRQVMSQSVAGLVTLHPLVNYLDALPVKMFEYMCAGIPVIASDFPLWRNIIAGNRCGLLVDPRKPEEIAKAIDQLINDPEGAKRMGQNGRKAVEKRYNWGAEERKLLSFYGEILKGPAK